MSMKKPYNMFDFFGEGALHIFFLKERRLQKKEMQESANEGTVVWVSQKASRGEPTAW